jgi:hypothetical protein
MNEIPFDCHGDVPYDCLPERRKKQHPWKVSVERITKTEQYRLEKKEEDAFTLVEVEEKSQQQPQELEELEELEEIEEYDDTSGPSDYFLQSPEDLKAELPNKEENVHDSSFESSSCLSLPFDEQIYKKEANVEEDVFQDIIFSEEKLNKASPQVFEESKLDESNEDDAASLSTDLEDSFLEEELPLPIILEEGENDEVIRDDEKEVFREEKSVSFQAPLQQQGPHKAYHRSHFGDNNLNKEEEVNTTVETSFTGEEDENYDSSRNSSFQDISYGEEASTVVSYTSLESLVRNQKSTTSNTTEEYRRFCLDLSFGSPVVAESAMEFANLFPKVTRLVADCMKTSDDSITFQEQDDYRTTKPVHQLVEDYESNVFGKSPQQQTTSPKPVATTPQVHSKSVVVICNDQDATISSTMVEGYNHTPNTAADTRTPVVVSPTSSISSFSTSMEPTTTSSKSVVVICDNQETISSNLVEGTA